MALGAQLLREWKRSLECYHLCMVSKAWCLSRAAGSKVVEFLCDRKALLVGRRDGTIIFFHDKEAGCYFGIRYYA